MSRDQAPAETRTETRCTSINPVTGDRCELQAGHSYPTHQARIHSRDPRPVVEWVAHVLSPMFIALSRSVFLMDRLVKALDGTVGADGQKNVEELRAAVNAGRAALADAQLDPAGPPKGWQPIAQNIRMAAASGRSFGHQATPQTAEKMVERKDEALQQILELLASVGIVGSVLREADPPVDQGTPEPRG